MSRKSASLRSLLRAPLLLTLGTSPFSAVADIIVTSCADDGSPGTLRDAVSRAADGDTVDMTNLTCGKITLATGAITVNQPSLKLLGPGAAQLEITSKYADRVIRHAQTGDLAIEALSVSGGQYFADSGNAYGGCVVSGGSVHLVQAKMTGCKALAPHGFASGGAVYARGLVELSYSVISEATAHSGLYAAHGGGITALNGLSMFGSTLAGNAVLTDSGGNPPAQFLHGAAGGGAYVGGNTNIAYSTLSGNSSSGVAGALDALTSASAVANALTMKNSTVSGNHAANVVGGIYATVDTTIDHSTIAVNSAAGGSDGSGPIAVGLQVIGRSGPINVSLFGTLVSGNTLADPASGVDFDTRNVSLTADRNLIRVPGSALPSGNLAGACPLLGPLRDNGGPTATHALLSHSPAIDAAPGSISGGTDQRRGSYARFSGPGLIADIGAYEVQQDDVVFNGGFDYCPAPR